MSEKLYDIETDDYPSQYGIAFRTVQVARCRVCGARTNRAVIGGHMTRGPRMPCAFLGEEWHWRIEDELDTPATHAGKIKDDIVGDADLANERLTNFRAMRTSPGAKKILEEVRRTAYQRK